MFVLSVVIVFDLVEWLTFDVELCTEFPENKNEM